MVLCSTSCSQVSSSFRGPKRYCARVTAAWCFYVGSLALGKLMQHYKPTIISGLLLALSLMIWHLKAETHCLLTVLHVPLTQWAAETSLLLSFVMM